MTTRRPLLAGALGSAAGLLGACATGTRIAEMGGRVAAIPAGMGRVWFYRSASPFGSALQPSIFLNGQAVGRAGPNGAFYRDVPPGEYSVAMTTEVTRQLTFTVAAGEERFVSTYALPGLLVAQVAAELVDPERGRVEVATKAFTGRT